MNIVYTDSKNEDFIMLCRLLDDHLNTAVGGETQRKQYIQYNTLESIKDVILIYQDGIAAACGSFKPYLEGIAEIKRMYVRESFRKRGLSKILMAELEKEARKQGYTKLYLETGRVLEAAVGLYQSVGFTRIENYGQYRDMPESVCFAKELL